MCAEDASFRRLGTPTRWYWARYWGESAALLAGGTRIQCARRTTSLAVSLATAVSIHVRCVRWRQGLVSVRTDSGVRCGLAATCPTRVSTGAQRWSLARSKRSTLLIALIECRASRVHAAPLFSLLIHRVSPRAVERAIPMTTRRMVIQPRACAARPRGTSVLPARLLMRVPCAPVEGFVLLVDAVASTA